MLQSDLNINFSQVVLTWCYNIESDVRFNSINEICTFNIVDGDILIDTWLLSSPFTAPDQADLLSMDLQTCIDTYEYAYTERNEIMSFQNMLYHADTTHLAEALLTTNDEGWLAFDTTLKKVVRYEPGTGFVALW